MINSFRPGYNSRVVYGVIFTPLLVYGLTQFFELQPVYCIGLMLIAWGIGLFYLWSDRKIQLFKHTNLQLMGLHLIFENFAWVREKYSEAELFELLQKYLSDDNWRNKALLLFRDSSWRCVVDSQINPVVYRWELKLNMPSDWSYEKEQLVFATMVLGCIPQRQDFSARWVNGYVLIRGGHYSIENAPTRIDQVTPSLAFWKIFQTHLNVMLDTFSGYSSPVFVPGLVLDVFLEYPCAFLLKEGSLLRIDQIQENNTVRYQAKVTSSDLKHSNTQLYDSVDELWWVWRHAIEKPMELPETREREEANKLRLKTMLLSLFQKHLG